MENPVMLLIEHSSGSYADSVFAQQVSENRFQLKETPLLFPELPFGSIVEARQDENGDWLFTQIVQTSPFASYRLIQSETETASFADLKQFVLQHNGHWEEMMGGVAFVHFPVDNRAALERALDAFQISREKIGEN